MHPAIDPAGTRFYRAVVALVGPLFRAYFRVRIEGAGHLPAAGACIVAANHQSYLDPLVVGATCPRAVRFMMARKFWDMPLIGWGSRRFGSFPVDDGRILPDALRQAVAVLRAGAVLGIFPEGGISADGRLGPPCPGVGHLALRLGVPIVPAAISGTRRAFPKGRLLPRPLRVRIRYGEPLAPPPGSHRDPGAADELAARVMAAIAALGA